MPTIGGSRALYQAQTGFRKDLIAGFKSLLERATGILILNATRVVDGKRYIPPNSDKSRDTLARIGDMVERFFVGPDYRQAYGNDGVSPLAEYPRILNHWLVWVQTQAVTPHSTFLRKRLPEDIVRWLESAQRPPVREQFIPNPLAEYEAAHTWVDPKGYQLSDRIWKCGVETRAKIDLLLQQGIAQGKSALEIASALEAYLLPTRTGIRTLKPYGPQFTPDGASYYAMRLARTEITRAHSQASLAAARGNPYVTGMDWALSASHPKIDVCDELATIGMSGERKKDPYPMDAVKIPPAHTHCLCNTRPFVGATNAEVVEELRAMMDNGEPAPVTPINADKYMRFMVGDLLISLVNQGAVAF
jgi:hypothetical protein